MDTTITNIQYRKISDIANPWVPPKEHNKFHDVPLTTAASLNNALTAPSRASKISWWLVTVLAMVGMIASVTLLILKYQQAHTAVSIKMIATRQPFPAITFCNLNPYKKSALASIPQLAQLVDRMNGGNSPTNTSDRGKREVGITGEPIPSAKTKSADKKVQTSRNRSNQPHAGHKRSKRAACTCDYTSSKSTICGSNQYILFPNAEVTWECGWECCESYRSNTPYANSRLARIENDALTTCLTTTNVLRDPGGWTSMYCPKTGSECSWTWNDNFTYHATVDNINASALCSNCMTYLPDHNANHNGWLEVLGMAAVCWYDSDKKAVTFDNYDADATDEYPILCEYFDSAVSTSTTSTPPATSTPATSTSTSVSISTSTSAAAPALTTTAQSTKSTTMVPSSTTQTGGLTSYFSTVSSAPSTTTCTVPSVVFSPAVMSTSTSATSTTSTSTARSTSTITSAATTAVISSSTVSSGATSEASTVKGTTAASTSGVRSTTSAANAMSSTSSTGSSSTSDLVTATSSTSRSSSTTRQATSAVQTVAGTTSAMSEGSTSSSSSTRDTSLSVTSSGDSSSTSSTGSLSDSTSTAVTASSDGTSSTFSSTQSINTSAGTSFTTTGPGATSSASIVGSSTEGLSTSSTTGQPNTSEVSSSLTSSIISTGSTSSTFVPDTSSSNSQTSALIASSTSPAAVSTSTQSVSVTQSSIDSSISTTNGVVSTIGSSTATSGSSTTVAQSSSSSSSTSSMSNPSSTVASTQTYARSSETSTSSIATATPSTSAGIITGNSTSNGAPTITSPYSSGSRQESTSSSSSAALIMSVTSSDRSTLFAATSSSNELSNTTVKQAESFSQPTTTTDITAGSTSNDQSTSKASTSTASSVPSVVPTSSASMTSSDDSSSGTITLQLDASSTPLESSSIAQTAKETQNEASSTVEITSAESSRASEAASSSVQASSTQALEQSTTDASTRIASVAESSTIASSVDMAMSTDHATVETNSPAAIESADPAFVTTSLASESTSSRIASSSWSQEAPVAATSSADMTITLTSPQLPSSTTETFSSASSSIESSDSGSSTETSTISSAWASDSTSTDAAGSSASDAGSSTLTQQSPTTTAEGTSSAEGPLSALSSSALDSSTEAATTPSPVPAQLSSDAVSTLISQVTSDESTNLASSDASQAITSQNKEPTAYVEEITTETLAASSTALSTETSFGSTGRTTSSTEATLATSSDQSESSGSSTLLPEASTQGDSFTSSPAISATDNNETSQLSTKGSSTSSSDQPLSTASVDSSTQSSSSHQPQSQTVIVDRSTGSSSSAIITGTLLDEASTVDDSVARTNSDTRPSTMPTSVVSTSRSQVTPTSTQSAAAEEHIRQGLDERDETTTTPVIASSTTARIPNSVGTSSSSGLTAMQTQRALTSEETASSSSTYPTIPRHSIASPTSASMSTSTSHRSKTSTRSIEATTASASNHSSSRSTTTKVAVSSSTAQALAFMLSSVQSVPSIESAGSHIMNSVSPSVEHSSSGALVKRTGSTVNADSMRRRTTSKVQAPGKSSTTAPLSNNKVDVSSTNNFTSTKSYSRSSNSSTMATQFGPTTVPTNIGKSDGNPMATMQSSIIVEASMSNAQILYQAFSEAQSTGKDDPGVPTRSSTNLPVDASSSPQATKNSAPASTGSTRFSNGFANRAKTSSTKAGANNQISNGSQQPYIGTTAGDSQVTAAPQVQESPVSNLQNAQTQNTQLSTSTGENTGSQSPPATGQRPSPSTDVTRGATEVEITQPSSTPEKPLSDPASSSSEARYEVKPTPPDQAVPSTDDSGSSNNVVTSPAMSLASSESAPGGNDHAYLSPEDLRQTEMEIDNALSVVRNSPMALSATSMDMLPYILASFPPEVAQSIGYSLEEMLMRCSYNGKECSNGDFKLVLDANYGNCYTFNHDSKYMTAAKLGDKAGLSVVFSVGEQQYMDQTQLAGLRTMIHQQGAPVFPDNFGFNVPSGFQVGVGMEHTHLKSLGTAAEPCVTSKDQVKRFNFNTSYAVEACQRSCYQDSVINRCQCGDPRVPLPPGSSVKYCSLSNRNCVNDYYESIEKSSNSKCDCPRACHDDVFDYSVSTTKWPSFQHEVLSNESPNKSTVAVSGGRSQLAKINMYYDTLIHLEYAEGYDYELLDLLSDIAACAGLLLGVSIMSIFEIVNIHACLRRHG